MRKMRKNSWPRALPLAGELKRAAGGLFALALGLLAPAAAAADYLIVEGGPGASADTHVLDGAPGALAADNIVGEGDDFVAVKASGRGNVMDNYGRVNGTVLAAPGAGLTIVNHAGATLGPGSAGNAVQAMVAEGDEGATHYNYVDLVLDNSGTVSGGVAAMGSMQLTNSGTLNGRDAGAAVNLGGGRGTLDNSGAINAGAEGVAIYNGYLVADDEGGGGEGGETVRTAPTLDLYHRAKGAINGDVVNHGTINVKKFDGKMTGNIVNLGTLNVGEQKVSFTGAYVSAEENGDDDGGDEPATGRSTLGLAIADGKHGALRALSGGGDGSGKVDLSHTDVVITARGGIAGDRYRLVDAAKGIKTLDATENGEGDNAETVTSSSRIILNRNSLTLDYNYVLHTGTDSRGYLDVVATARPRAFHNNSNERDQEMADALDAIAPAVPGDMRALMWRLNAIRTSPAMRQALESVNNRSASSAMSQLTATAVASHLNAAKSLFRELGSNQLAAFSRGTARAAAGGEPVGECGAAAAPAGDYYCWNTFGRLYGSFGYQEERADMAGYDLKTAGVLAGLDYAFARELRAGVLGGFSYNTSELGRHLGDNTDLMTRVGLYGCFNWDGLYVDVSPTFGLHRLKSERRVHVDEWSTRAENERWAWDLNLLLNAGVTINLPGRTYFTPEFSIAPGVFHAPDYEESGAADNFNLRVDSQTNWSLLQTLGFRLGTVIDLGCGTQLKPEFSLAWEHEYLDTAGETTNAFVAAPDRSWRNVLNGIERDRLLISLGLSALVMDDLSVYLRWDQRIWEDGYTCSFSAGAAYGF